MTSRPEYVRIDNFVTGINNTEDDYNSKLIISALYFQEMIWLINRVGIVVERDDAVVNVSFPYMVNSLNQLWFYVDDILPATEEDYDRCVMYFMEKALRD